MNFLLKQKKVISINDISLILSTLFVILTITFSFISFLFFNRINQTQLDAFGKRTIENLSTSLEMSLWFLDPGAAKDICDFAMGDLRLKNILLTDDTGYELYSNSNEQFGGCIKYSKKIYHDDLYIGNIEISVANDQFEEIKKKRFYSTMIFVIVMFIISYFISKLILKFFFIIPLSNFAQVLKEKGQIDEKKDYPNKYQYYLPIISLFSNVFNELKNETKRLETETSLLKRELEEKRGEIGTLNSIIEKRFSEISEAQTFFTKNQKTAASNQLVIGISHELNTPLGAIISSNRSLNLKLNNIIANFSKIFSSISDEDADFINKTLSEIIENKLYIDLGMNYTEKKMILKKYENIPVEDKEYFIEQLINTGIYQYEDLTFKLIELRNYKNIFKIITEFSDFIRLTNIINVATDKASSVIKALRVYAGMDDREDKKIPINITEDIDSVLLLYHSQMKDNISVVKNYRSDKKIIGNRHRLNQVWVNLINNALQAMDYNGKLTITIEDDGEYITISFNDTGIGISESDKNFIFNPFFTTKKSGEGIGLGLNLSKDIIEEHKGTIFFNSQKGNTTFFVRLKIMPDWVLQMNNI